MGFSESSGRRARDTRRRAAQDDTGWVQVGDYRYTVGPLIGLLALATILLMSRFVFGTGRPTKPALPTDFGLLVPVASMPTRAAAEVARGLLAEHGIRATLADQQVDAEPVRISADGRVLPPRVVVPATDVLVFPADASGARALLTSG